MITAQVVETSVTVNDNSPIQDYVHPDDQTYSWYFFCGPFLLLYSWSSITEAATHARGPDKVRRSAEARHKLA